METGYHNLTIRPGAHLLIIQPEPVVGICIAAQIVARGLRENDACLFIGSRTNAETLRSCLLVEGADPEREVNERHLAMLTKRDSLLLGGELDPDGVIELLHGFVKESLDGHNDAARIVVNVPWLVGDDEQSLMRSAFHDRADELFNVPDLPALGVSIYNRSDLSPGEEAQLLARHPLAIINGRVNINPFFEQRGD